MEQEYAVGDRVQVQMTEMHDQYDRGEFLTVKRIESSPFHGKQILFFENNKHALRQDQVRLIGRHADPLPEKTTVDLYFEFLEETTKKMIAISRAKNKDYTGGTVDPFANFTRVEGLEICSTEQGFLTRITDKLCRVASFVKQGTLEVKDESVEDTLIDMANYSLLMLGYLKYKKGDFDVKR